MVNNFIFVDEIEHINKNIPMMYYMCLSVIEMEVDFVEKQVIKAIESLKDGFHANRIYRKNNPNYIVMNSLTNIIISNKLRWFCFFYKKDDINNPRLKILKDIEFKGVQIEIDNYRKVGLLLLFHMLNSFIPSSKIKPLYRVVIAEDVFKKQTQIFPGGEKVLDNIESYCFTSPLRAPILNLCDHAGYLFGKILRAQEIIDDKLQITQKNFQSIYFRTCYKHLYEIAKASSFIFKNVFDWIDLENEKIK